MGREIRKTVNEVTGLPTIAEREARAKKDMEDRIQMAKDDYAQTMKRITECYQLAADLHGAGLPVELSRYNSMEGLRVELGVRPDPRRQKRAYLAWVKRLADCKRILGAMESSGRSLFDARKRLVSQNLTPKAFPQVCINFKQKLDKGGKCRIERRRSSSSYSTLVCDA